MNNFPACMLHCRYTMIGNIDGKTYNLSEKSYIKLSSHRHAWVAELSKTLDYYEFQTRHALSTKSQHENNHLTQYKRFLLPYQCKITTTINSGRLIYMNLLR